jgi:N-acyl-D-amino-acid deacylase
LEGSSIRRLGELWSLKDEAAARRVIAEGGEDTVVITHSMAEADVAAVIAHPIAMVGSDGLPAGSRPHPRLFGTFPRVLGRFVREQRLLDDVEAIRKMARLPAVHFRLGRRGCIAPGWAADIVVYDPTKVADLATYEDPRCEPAGIARVLVNGRTVMVDGHHTGARPGRVIRRTEVGEQRHPRPVG